MCTVFLFSTKVRHEKIREKKICDLFLILRHKTLIILKRMVQEGLFSLLSASETIIYQENMLNSIFFT